MKLWVIEDDAPFRTLVKLLLEQESYEVEEFGDAASALAALKGGPPDLALLDIGLPGEGGEKVCEALSRHAVGGRPVPVIVITGHADLSDRYRMFASGADDYLTKPVDNLELVMRVRNKLRRGAAGRERAGRYMEAGEISLDVANHQIRIADRQTALTPSELAIMRHLLTQPGRAFTTETLLTEALGYPPRLGNPDILRTHVRKIRQKIEEDAGDPKVLVNVPRVGYMVASAAVAT